MRIIFFMSFIKNLFKKKEKIYYVLYYSLADKVYENTIFNNNGKVYLMHLEKIPKLVTFNNNGDVYLHNLKELNNKITFNNKGYVYLDNKIKLNKLNNNELNNLFNKLPDNSPDWLDYLSKKDLLPKLREYKLNKIL